MPIPHDDGEVPRDAAHPPAGVLDVPLHAPAPDNAVGLRGMAALHGEPVLMVSTTEVVPLKKITWDFRPAFYAPHEGRMYYVSIFMLLLFFFILSGSISSLLYLIVLS